LEWEGNPVENNKKSEVDLPNSDREEWTLFCLIGNKIVFIHFYRFIFYMCKNGHKMEDGKNGEKEELGEIK
jgi:hypothetical protein